MCRLIQHLLTLHALQTDECERFRGAQCGSFRRSPPYRSVRSPSISGDRALHLVRLRRLELLLARSSIRDRLLQEGYELFVFWEAVGRYVPQMGPLVFYIQPIDWFHASTDLL